MAPRTNGHSFIRRDFYAHRLTLLLVAETVPRLPNRLTTLYLNFCGIYCINNYSYKLNQKKEYFTLPKALMRLRVSWTKIYRPPTGLFICVYISSINPMKQIVSRESIIKIFQSRPMAYKKIVYTPKSITEISLFNTRINTLYPEKSISFRIYNLYSRLIVNKLDYWPCAKLSLRTKNC